MSTNNFRHSSPTAVAQVQTVTITAASSANNSTWSATLTLSDGTTAVATYTEDGSPTVAEIATGLYTAWAASTNPFIQEVTATNPSSGVVVFTGATAGRPFSIAVTCSGDGTKTSTATTANVGSNDYGTARLWSLDAVPTSSDNVVITSGTTDILYTLNQSAVSIGAFTVNSGYSGKIGRFDNGLPFYLRIAPTSFNYQGSSQRALFDLGSSNIGGTINASGSSLSGYYQVYLKGSNLATWVIQKGTVAIAMNYGETSTISKVQTPEPTGSNTPTVYIGSGTTLTTVDAGSGTIYQQCASTTTTCGTDATLYTSGSGAITTVNAYGTSYLSSSGTITTLNAYGTVDFSKDRTARTVTTLNAYAGCKITLGSWITLTNGIAFGANPGSFTITIVK